MESVNGKILTLRGIALRHQHPSYEFEEHGTLQEFRDKLLDKPFGMRLVMIGDRVTNYCENVGEHLFNTLDYGDISSVIGTLETVNDWLGDTGDIVHEKAWDKHFCMYSAIESDVFRDAEKRDRINLIRSLDPELTDESIRDTAKYCMGNEFLGNPFCLMDDIWKEKYPTLKKDVTDIWNKKVCEDIVFPYLEEQL